MTGPWNNKSLPYPHQLPWELGAKHFPCRASVTRPSHHQGRYYCHNSHKVEEISRVPGRGPLAPAMVLGVLLTLPSLCTASIQADTYPINPLSYLSSQFSLTPLSISTPSRPSQSHFNPYLNASHSFYTG